MYDQSEPTGLRYRKLDLHCHTTESDGTATPTEMVKAASDRGLDAIAITDHNTGNGLDEAKAAGQELGIVVFPGVELTVTSGESGIHLLALFDPSCSSDQIKALLGFLEIAPDTWGRDDAVSTKSPVEAIEAICQRGGVACAAHASSSKGLFQDMRGQQRLPPAQHPGLLGVELSSLDDNTAQVLRDPTSHYRRKFALYQASDAHCADEVGRRFSHFKMGEVTIGSLKQCFYDPETRIRPMNTPPPVLAGYRIERVAFRGGFLDGETIQCHSGLNCILGGKGVGQSLVIEFFRFGLDQACEDVPEIYADHCEKLEDCLELDGEVVSDIASESGSAYTVVRRFDDSENPILILRDGNDIGEASPSELFPILAYSQNEAISISRNHRAQLALVDGFVDSTSIERRQNSRREELRGIDTDLAECMAAQEELPPQRRLVATCKERLHEVEDKIDNPVFDEIQIWESVREHIGRSLTLAEHVEDTATQAIEGIDRENACKPFDAKGHGKDMANQVLKHAASMKDGVRDAIAAAQVSAAIKRTCLDESHREFVEAFALVKTRYLSAVGEGEDQEDLEQSRDRIGRELRELEKTEPDLEQKAQRQIDLKSERRELLRKVKQDSDELFRRRLQKYNELSDQSHGKIRLNIEKSADKSKFRQRLEQLVTGSNIRKAYMAQIADSAKPAEFVDSLISRDTMKIAAWCDMSEEMLDRFVDWLLSLEDRKKILDLSYDYDAEEKPLIEYRKPGGSYAEIARLSVGQKCSALVMIALADQNRTVVMDQPEDSLDVISVFEDVSHTLRSGKDSRQFIVTTHNPNVAVTSDTDLYQIVDADAEHGWIESAGPMDVGNLRKRVIRQLEGGPAAYELRRRKYEG